MIGSNTFATDGTETWEAIDFVFFLFLFFCWKVINPLPPNNAVRQQKEKF